jgi:hypothetical protein
MSDFAAGASQLAVDTHFGRADAGSGTVSAAGGHSNTATHRTNAPELAETIAQIRAAHRERVFWMKQRKRSDLALGSYLRSALGWRMDKPQAERTAIAAQAQDILKAGERHLRASRRAIAAAGKGKPIALPEMDEVLRPYVHIVVPNIEMRTKLDELEATATRQMTRLARSLPVYQWAEGVRGFGALGLAIIVGEAGDLGGYANPGKLWKRMGVAVIDGLRQGAVPVGLSQEARKNAWIERKYSPVRRSRLYTVGTALLMSGNEEYRTVYLDRKGYEVAKAEADGLKVVPAAKIPARGKDAYRSLGHIDQRSRRYTEKRLLRNLWQAWRNPLVGEAATERVS